MRNAKEAVTNKLAVILIYHMSGAASRAFSLKTIRNNGPVGGPDPPSPLQNRRELMQNNFVAKKCFLQNV